MKLFDFLLSKMKTYKDKIAFANNNMSYEELIETIKNKAKKYKETNKLIYTYKTAKEKQAVEILSIIASKNVCVPVSENYGLKQKKYIINQIKNDNEDYPDLSFIMFTSGTTSKSKGVMLTDENIIYNLKAIDNYFNISNDKKILIIKPLIHISALVGELLYGLYKGLTIHFYDDILLPKKIDNYIETYKIDILGLTPTMCNLFLKSKCELKSLKHAVIGGEILNCELAKSLSENYPGINFYNVYGMTENSPRATVLLPHEFKAFPGSVGKPLINTSIKIKDNEVLIKSNSIMKGYYKNEKLTNKKIQNKYFHTGDSGYFNQEGYLYILGRKDNVIIKGGFNIYPEEIENIVKSYKGVFDCLVYKIKDKYLLESIGLKVVGNIKIDKLLNYLNMHLPTILIPNRIEIVDRLEKTSSGKVKR